MSCPSCSSPIAIPTASRAPAVQITVGCQCGQRFAAPPHLAGKQIPCPVCRQPIFVPQSQSEVTDPFLGDVSSMVSAAPTRPPPPSTSFNQPTQGFFQRSTQKKQKRQMPESARNASVGLAIGGFLWTTFTGVGIYLISTKDIDSVGQWITAYFSCLAIGGYISAILVWQRVPFAIVPATLIAGCYGLFAPLGTLIAVFIFIALFNGDTRQYLARARHS